MQQKYDTIIIGAGPAGCTVARLIAEKGFKVIVIEKNDFGEVSSCGEFIPKLIRAELDFENSCIAQSTDRIVTHLPDGDIVKTDAPGYVLNRGEFNKALQNDTFSTGCDILFNTAFKKIKSKNSVALQNGRIIKADIIIAADGALSTLRKKGCGNITYCIGTQYEIKIKSKIEDAHIFFDKDWYGGYGWLFPKNDTINIGVAVRYDKKIQTPTVYLKKLTKILKQKFNININTTDIISMYKGWIPVSGQLKKCTINNIIFIGDAACYTHPITGAGILYAVLSAKIAAHTIVKAFEKSDLTVLEEYEKMCTKYFAHTFAHALTRRKYLDTHWYYNDEKLTSVLKKCWVVFDEYYKIQL